MIISSSSAVAAAVSHGHGSQSVDGGGDLEASGLGVVAPVPVLVQHVETCTQYSVDQHECEAMAPEAGGGAAVNLVVR
jgi:hypothetical protein